jgi:hypothetical protein
MDLRNFCQMNDIFFDTFSIFLFQKKIDKLEAKLFQGATFFIIIITNVLSAPLFLECRSALAPWHKKRAHSHFRSLFSKGVHSFIALF